MLFITSLLFEVDFIVENRLNVNLNTKYIWLAILIFLEKNCIEISYGENYSRFLN